MIFLLEIEPKDTNSLSCIKKQRGYQIPRCTTFMFKNHLPPIFYYNLTQKLLELNPLIEKKKDNYSYQKFVSKVTKQKLYTIS